MKFLEIDKLADLTAKLTDASIGVGDRFINGRIEAFTMKRAGTDKKYAHALGEKFQHELDFVHTEIAELRKSIGRSMSVGSKVEIRNSVQFTKTKGKRRSLSLDESTNKKGKRRSLSMDESTSKKKSRQPSQTIDMPPRKLKSCLKSRSEPLYVDVNKSPNFSYSNSALGDFQHTCTRRLMTDIILTLNISFPDYDFSNVKPSHFEKVQWNNSIIHRTNEKLSDLELREGRSFLNNLWNSIDDVINIAESDVYSYAPPNKFDDDDPLSFLMHTLDDTDATNMVPLWTFNFFFINKSLKRILLFTCVQTVRNGIALSTLDETEKMESFKYSENFLPFTDREEEDEYDDPEYYDINCMGQAVTPPPLPAALV